eukprot:1176684-Prorocentrum_minimum.AAC.1
MNSPAEESVSEEGACGTRRALAGAVLTAMRGSPGGARQVAVRSSSGYLAARSPPPHASLDGRASLSSRACHPGGEGGSNQQFRLVEEPQSGTNREGMEEQIRVLCERLVGTRHHRARAPRMTLRATAPSTGRYWTGPD